MSAVQAILEAAEQGNMERLRRLVDGTPLVPPREERPVLTVVGPRDDELGPGVTLIDRDLRAAEFLRVELGGATFHAVDLRRTRFHDVDLTGAAITDSRIDGLTIWGVEVKPLIVAHRVAVAGYYGSRKAEQHDITRVTERPEIR
jgi:hypothetical protein